MNCKQSHTPRFQELAKCAKTNGTTSMVITSTFQITTQALGITRLPSPFYYETSKLAHHLSDDVTSYWDLTLEEQDRLYLPKQYNEYCYIAIEVFQGEKRINVPIHVRDLQAEGMESMHRR
jgi:hypothetical protein